MAKKKATTTKKATATKAPAKKTEAKKAPAKAPVEKKAPAPAPVKKAFQVKFGEPLDVSINGKPQNFILQKTRGDIGIFVDTETKAQLWVSTKALK